MDCFSHKKSSSKFHLLVSTPIPFHVSSFELGGERESAVSLNKWIYEELTKSLEYIEDKLTEKCYGLVTDSPNIMLKTRTLSTGAISGGIMFAQFSDVLAMHYR